MNGMNKRGFTRNTKNMIFWGGGGGGLEGDLPSGKLCAAPQACDAAVKVYSRLFRGLFPSSFSECFFWKTLFHLFSFINTNKCVMLYIILYISIYCYISRYSFLKTQFDITVASEIMAILALTTDLRDMRKRFVWLVLSVFRWKICLYCPACTQLQCWELLELKKNC